MGTLDISKGWGRGTGVGSDSFTVSGLPGGVFFFAFESLVAQGDFTVQISSGGIILDAQSGFFTDSFQSQFTNALSGMFEFGGGTVTISVTAPTGVTWKVGWSHSELDQEPSHWTVYPEQITDNTASANTGHGSWHSFDPTGTFGGLTDDVGAPNGAILKKAAVSNDIAELMGLPLDASTNGGAGAASGGYEYFCQKPPMDKQGLLLNMGVHRNGLILDVPSNDYVYKEWDGRILTSAYAGPGWSGGMYALDRLGGVVSESLHIEVSTLMPAIAFDSRNMVYLGDDVMLMTVTGYEEADIYDESAVPPDTGYTRAGVGKAAVGPVLVNEYVDTPSDGPVAVFDMEFSADGSGAKTDYDDYTGIYQQVVVGFVVTSASIEAADGSAYENMYVYSGGSVRIDWQRQTRIPPLRQFLGFPLWGTLYINVGDGVKNWKAIGPRNPGTPGRLKIYGAGDGTQYGIEEPGTRRNYSESSPVMIYNPSNGAFEFGAWMHPLAGSGGPPNGGPTGGGTGGGGTGGGVTGGTDPSATGHPGDIYNPWSGYSITGTWQDHMSYSLGGIDYPLAYGTAIAAPAAGTLHTSGGSGEFTAGWVGSAGRRSVLYLDTPMPRVNANLEQNEGSGPIVAIVLQHQSAFGTNGKHYGKGDFCGMSGASADGSDHGGDVHLHVHGLNASGHRVDFLNYV